MKPYLKDKQQGSPKFKTVHNDGTSGFAKGISAYDKLTTRNANRSRKKAAQQEAKRKIADTFELYNSIL